MRKNLNEVRRILIIVTIVEALLLFFFRAGLDRMILPAVIILIIQIAAFVYLTERFESLMEEQAIGVREELGATAEKAYLFGEVGLLMYDDDYVITKMSELFEQRGLNHVGTKVLSWLPEVDPLISGEGAVEINYKGAVMSGVDAKVASAVSGRGRGMICCGASNPPRTFSNHTIVSLGVQFLQPCQFFGECVSTAPVTESMDFITRRENAHL